MIFKATCPECGKKKAVKHQTVIAPVDYVQISAHLKVTKPGGVAFHKIGKCYKCEQK
tara:strand:- start:2657 stop:2827 length:171 start_codon:yes stop_codon:yes gene_type:complete